ncbi:MAG: metallophosphoesterase, partial [Chitinophagaceae bacterium]
MRKILQRIFRKPVSWLAHKVASRPVKKDIFESLNILVKGIQEAKDEYGFVINYELEKGKFIIFSDQHKGAKDAADDFRNAEENYHCALEHYY